MNVGTINQSNNNTAFKGWMRVQGRWQKIDAIKDLIAAGEHKAINETGEYKPFFSTAEDSIYGQYYQELFVDGEDETNKLMKIKTDFTFLINPRRMEDHYEAIRNTTAKEFPQGEEKIFDASDVLEVLKDKTIYIIDDIKQALAKIGAK